MIPVRDNNGNYHETAAIYDNSGREIAEVRDNQGRLLFKNWNELTGIPPLAFKSRSGYLKDYRISGNTIQNGEPSPDNPVEVVGVGERTVNLFDANNAVEKSYLSQTGSILNQSGWFLSDFIMIAPLKEYVFNPNSSQGNSGRHCFYDEDKKLISAIASGMQIFTTPSNAKYIRFSYRDSSYDITLTPGTTAPDHYIPYGYEVDLETRGVNLFDEKYENIGTSLVYQPIRVGDGEFTLSTTTPLTSNNAAIFLLSGNVNSGASTPINGVSETRYRTVTAVNDFITIAYRNVSDIHPSDYHTILTSVTTPPTHYEPYHEPITTPVYIGDEPLMDGEYVSYKEQKIYRMIDGILAPTDPPVSLPPIPTINGTNILSVETQVQPSEMYIKYRR